MASQKSIHSLVIDTGPLIRNVVSVSSLLQQAECLFTTPAIISEIRDPATRSRVETTLLPFLNIRSPTPASYEIVAQFSRKTGDFAVLSRPDLQILALAYELECERLDGDWRLRRTPGQKGLNGSPPNKKADTEAPSEPISENPTGVNISQSNQVPMPTSTTSRTESKPPATKDYQEHNDPSLQESVPEKADTLSSAEQSDTVCAPSHDAITANLLDLQISSQSEDSPASDEAAPEGEAETVDDDSEGGWITPSNIKKHQAKSNSSLASQTNPQKQMAVATITTDFAMQNVLLQMNLNLLSNNLQRVKNLRTWILRCHACFFTTKQMDKQFCPRCGQPALTRVACSTNANGEFKIHLKRNFQWNSRGDRYSIPKPVPGSANGKINVGGGGKGGGKGGWGQSLILAEDQKEYVKAMGEQKRQKHRDLMDEDYLPAILTGDRGRAGGRPKVGAGKNVNSRKRF